MDDWRRVHTRSPHPSNRPVSYAEFNEHFSYARFPGKIGRTSRSGWSEAPNSQANKCCQTARAGKPARSEIESHDREGAQPGPGIGKIHCHVGVKCRPSIRGRRDFAVDQLNHMIRLGSQIVVVGDHDDGQVLVPAEGCQRIHDLAPVFGIEISRRLIG
jgi:hypothetical protein